eukprot:CAMPEP_0168508918 /NCGR_PEP_ID=MMETSP0405-20121227/425_1 /TAXON_ID=498012 /ORGANISM="Trichosphaerium sp, Strain Am-I-7 wt" /LENGTH=814 /DNA_ID=CAMNT_0008526195 /DNA_START=58 /DNA_END=2502 /DNA_ORIENTATION=+
MVYRNCGISLSRKRGVGATQTVTEFLHEAGPDFGMKKDDNLQMVESKSGIGCQVYRYRQLSKDGFPIVPSDVTVTTDTSTSELMAISVLYSDVADEANMFLKLPLKTAVAYAKMHASITELRNQEPYNPEIIMYHKADTSKTIPCWKFVLLSKAPLGDFIFIVDASTQEPTIHEFHNQLREYAVGQGRVYIPNPIQALGMDAIFLNENNVDSFPGMTAAGKMVELHNLETGTDLLVGKYVNPLIKGNNYDACSDAKSSSREYIYERTDPRFSQVMAYYHIDRVQTLIQSIGFTGESSIRNFPTLVAIQSSPDDQSYFSPFERPESGGIIHMGEGGVNDAQDGDIIVHEYGHALQYAQNSNFYGGEMPAMGEGFSDWLAAIVFAEDGDENFMKDHASCIGEWDTPYPEVLNVLNYPRCLRRVDADFLPYEAYYRGTGSENYSHFNGMIWSSTLWEIFKLLGLNDSLRIVLESHYGLPMGSTYPTAARAILDANRSLRDGKDEYEIRVIFDTKHILSLEDSAAPTTKPPTTLPPTKSPTTEPPTTISPTTEPPTTQPPPTEPPTTQSPTTIPATTVPPVSETNTTLNATTIPTTEPTAQANTTNTTQPPTQMPTPTQTNTTNTTSPTEAPYIPTPPPTTSTPPVSETNTTSNTTIPPTPEPPTHSPTEPPAETPSVPRTIAPTGIYINPKDNPTPPIPGLPADSHTFRCIGGIADIENRSCNCVDQECLCYAEQDSGVSCHCNDVDWCVAYTHVDTKVYGGTAKSLIVYWTHFSTIYCEDTTSCACYGGNDAPGACYRNNAEIFSCVLPDTRGLCM